MLSGPRLKTVSHRTLGFPEYGMANASNFTRGFTPASNPERGNNIGAMKWAFIYVKRANAKNSVISYLRVPRVRNGGSNFTRMPSTPKGVNSICATKLAFIYVKKAKAKKHQRPAHTPRHSQLHLRRRLHRVARQGALPLPATPKGVTT